MFGKLKEKFKSVIGLLSKKVDEQAKEETIEVVKTVEKPKEKPKQPVKELKKAEEAKAAEKPEKKLKLPEKPKIHPGEDIIEPKKGFLKKLKERITKEKPRKEQKTVPEAQPKKEERAVEEEKPKSFFEKIKEKVVTKTITEKQFEELFWDLEVMLLENNVALEVIDKIKNDLKKQLVNVPLRKNGIEEEIAEALKKSIEGLFAVQPIDLLQKIKEKKEKPFTILFLGINGGGKTTSLAKVAHFLQKNGLSCILVAADTWRAASIEQLEEHGKNLGVKVIKHNYASDPAAVCFDGIKHAQAKGIDVVLIDTAGRIHSNVNLMKEMEKIVRVAKPDLKIFVGESITGNDCTEQMVKFNEAVNVDAAILTKVDVDDKGGAAISISYVSGKPILFLGMGQRLDDLEQFDKQKILASLGF